MTFKGKLVKPRIILSKSGKHRMEPPFDVVFEFDGDVVLFPSMDAETLAMLNRNGIHDRERYLLKKLSEHDEYYTTDSKYQAQFSNGLWNIIPDSFNEWKIKWVHKLYWIHKEPIAAIGLIIAILTLIATIIFGVLQSAQ